jgi:hypothetical protein
MTASANGWRLIDRAECAVIDVPGGRLPVHPRLAVVFSDLAHRYHELVEPLLWPGCWGWAGRPVRGQTTLPSNHWSGTGVDLCAPRHPQGRAAAATFSPGQLTVIRRDLLPRYQGVLTWGGDWDLPDCDGMHWEVTKGVTPLQVDALSAALSGQAPPAPAPAPSPPPPRVVAPGPGWTGPDLTGHSLALRGEEGHNGARVSRLQAWLRSTFPLYAKGLGVDGWWGPQTTGVMREFGQRSGVRSADGRNIGPQLARKLYLSGFRG